ncbi:hypothetical protein [Rhodobaculum claviforme]|uniref:Uncharacterized protein n=1 Tax=Rhodobaculum claviforme TaxID=1549854 RepID=A0A934TPT3_9RHOB|nr:hypothetical protein [Rhodobaculum claviforme]MBK5928923.1 hypothetical protein [Rhodobaculum claviforme]
MGEIVAVLSLGTLGAVLAFAYASVRAMEKLRAEGGRKSTLSRDGAAERLAELRAEVRVDGR